VASLGLMSDGAATDGVTLFFSFKKVTTFLVVVLKSNDFLVIVIFTLIPYPPSTSSFLLYSLQNIDFHQGVRPMMVSPGAVRPPRSQVTPCEWPHLWHIVSADRNDKLWQIINKRNILCGQINNVLCYFRKCQSLVKQKVNVCIFMGVDHGGDRGTRPPQNLE